MYLHDPIDAKHDLIGLSILDLHELFEGIGIDRAKMRAKQAYYWINAKGAQNFDAMSDISKDVRSFLNNHAHINRPAISHKQKSSDGTIKWLLNFNDGNQAEMVFIPDESRGTLCISSQVGCTLTCKFCHTGTQRLVRNLTVSEIVGQVMLARDELDDWKTEQGTRWITNIVFMGMGEPLYNTDNVISAIKILTDGDGIAISKRKVTLSTSGIVPDIHRVGAETGVSLAISLHAVRDDLRDILVPINKKYPLKMLLEAVGKYPAARNARRVTWEYVMLRGVNDSLDDAKELVKIMHKIPSKVNLIPFNAWPGAPYECSDSGQIQKFAEIIWKAGYSAPVRTPRGRDILAACGQLKSASERLRKHQKIS